MSALKQEGMEQLEKIIADMFNLGELEINDQTLITNIRHKDLIETASKSAKMAIKAIESKMPIEVVSINIKEILDSLGEITGENTTEDVIDGIFKKFCLGK